MELHIHIHHHGDDAVHAKLNHLTHLTNKIMATVTELNEKVDLLQATIDETQAAALGKITSLETTIQELRDEIAAGGNATALQAIADKLDAATADLKSTFPAPEA